jgi:hypothetical protein
LKKLLARMSRSVPAAAEFVDVVEQSVVKSKNSVAALFKHGYTRYFGALARVLHVPSLGLHGFQIGCRRCSSLRGCA